MACYRDSFTFFIIKLNHCGFLYGAGLGCFPVSATLETESNFYHTSANAAQAGGWVILGLFWRNTMCGASRVPGMRYLQVTQVKGSRYFSICNAFLGIRQRKLFSMNITRIHKTRMFLAMQYLHKTDLFRENHCNSGHKDAI
jgi:hypothetical protein